MIYGIYETIAMIIAMVILHKADAEKRNKYYTYFHKCMAQNY
jgi:hypothetical protein